MMVEWLKIFGVGMAAFIWVGLALAIGADAEKPVQLFVSVVMFAAFLASYTLSLYN